MLFSELLSASTMLNVPVKSIKLPEKLDSKQKPRPRLMARSNFSVVRPSYDIQRLY